MGGEIKIIHQKIYKTYVGHWASLPCGTLRERSGQDRPGGDRKRNSVAFQNPVNGYKEEKKEMLN
jgi:hypothetical protein